MVDKPISSGQQQVCVRMQRAAPVLLAWSMPWPTVGNESEAYRRDLARLPRECLVSISSITPQSSERSACQDAQASREAQIEWA